MAEKWGNIIRLRVENYETGKISKCCTGQRQKRECVQGLENEIRENIPDFVFWADVIFTGGKCSFWISLFVILQMCRIVKTIFTLYTIDDRCRYL